MKPDLLTFLVAAALCFPLCGISAPTRNDLGSPLLSRSLAAETERIAVGCLADIKTLQDWQEKREGYRAELFEMLSLSPLPARADLQAKVTGRIERDDFSVEKLHFQSMPGLYVTANLYLPKNLAKPAPAVLYLCGHGPVVKDGVSFGNKVTYQHHGAWFAQHGYVCLLIDTIQLGEIQGLHHGTYREGMWWWNARGYSPAGVEAWNSIRALDYLATRPEVDTNRFGATGRSGGGAYSWWVAALDDRVKAAAPVAGIADLHNHVVDGTVEGHCDCMFIVNTYRWDYAQVAALVAPRPLLLVNTDSDSIFPLDGVMRVHDKVRRIYELHRAGDKFGLTIGPGGHNDTQDLQVPVMRWFNRHLKGEDPSVADAALKYFEPEQLKVFAELPSGERSSKIHETFVAEFTDSEPPKQAPAWTQQSGAWLAALREKSFRGWPTQAPTIAAKGVSSKQSSGLVLQTSTLNSDADVELQLWLLHPSTGLAKGVTLNVLDDMGWTNWIAAMRYGFASSFAESRIPGDHPNLGQDQLTGSVDPDKFAALRQQIEATGHALAWFVPRGAGPTRGHPDARKQVQISRRYMLLGQTRDSMQVWDIRRAMQLLRSIKETRELPLTVAAERNMACNVLYASLFEPAGAKLKLDGLPASHRQGPDYLNVLRYLDIPQALAMAAERNPVEVSGVDASAFAYVTTLGQNLGWAKERVILR